jgi:hypothetical protein
MFSAVSFVRQEIQVNGYIHAAKHGTSMILAT